MCVNMVLIKQYDCGYDLTQSKEFSSIQSLNTAINGLMEEGAYVKRGEKTKAS